jgi:mono/diheme cytochrome c family protein
MTPLIARVCISILIVMAALSLAARVMSKEAPNYFKPTLAPTAKQLFVKHCASCHGRDGRATTNKGKFSHARDLADAEWQDDVTDERIFNSIMNGRNIRGNMPAFSDRFSEAQVNSLVTLVRGLRK